MILGVDALSLLDPYRGKFTDEWTEFYWRVRYVVQNGCSSCRRSACHEGRRRLSSWRSQTACFGGTGSGSAGPCWYTLAAWCTCRAWASECVPVNPFDRIMATLVEGVGHGR